MLPEAHIAFLDAVFKANSAILNSLLGVINKRIYHEAGQAHPVPLLSLFGASNGTSEDDSLNALYDRFLLRVVVPPLAADASIRALFDLQPSPPAAVITLDELRKAQEQVAQVQLTNDTIEAAITIKHGLEDEGIAASDRRWKSCADLVRAKAWLEGESQTSGGHVLLRWCSARGELQHVFVRQLRGCSARGELQHDCDIQSDTRRHLPSTACPPCGPRSTEGASRCRCCALPAAAHRYSVGQLWAAAERRQTPLSRHARARGVEQREVWSNAMDDMELPDFAGKVVVLYLRHASRAIQDGVALENPSFEQRRGRLFLVMLYMEYESPDESREMVTRTKPTLRQKMGL